LLKAGYNVIIVDDLSNSFRDVFDRVLIVAHQHFDRVGGRCPQAILYDIDYRDNTAVNALLTSYSSARCTIRRSNIAAVIHFAAFKAVEESIRQPLKYYRNNISGLVGFLGLLEAYDIKTFIFSSSATVYGTLADSGLPLREEHCAHQKQTYHDSDGIQRQSAQGCTGLTNPYGRTKFFGEAILADLAVSDPSWTITALRYFNPIGCDSSGLLGEDPKGTPSNLVPVVTKVMTGQWKQLSIFGSDWDTPDGTAIRDFIHVTDLAKGHIAALAAAESGSFQRRQLPENFRIFNLGTGSGHSVTEIVTTMEEVSKRPIPRVMVSRRAGDVGLCVAIADREALELGWKPERSLKNACEDICKFLSVRET
jgi:UDP-glucose 4-epimerase